MCQLGIIIISKLPQTFGHDYGLSGLTGYGGSGFPFKSVQVNPARGSVDSIETPHLHKFLIPRQLSPTVNYFTSIEVPSLTMFKEVYSKGREVRGTQEIILTQIDS